MRRWWLSACGILVFGTAVLGQEVPTETPVPVVPPAGVGPVTLSGEVVPDAEPAPQRPARPVWIEATDLLWWIRHAPLPVPILTTGNPADAVPGALGQPGTHVLVGGGSLEENSLPGFQGSVGDWLDSDGGLGVEVSGFFLGERGTSFPAWGSRLSSNPPLYVPFVNATTGAESSYTIADPLLHFGTAGTFSMNTTARLWGAEGNALFNLARGHASSLEALAGFRYLNLEESLTINTFSNIVAFDDQVATTDFFGTRNQFYGGQVGLRAETHYGEWSLSLTSRVALGWTHQAVETNGALTATGAGAVPAGTFPGGLFTQASNIGRFTHQEFSVVPQVGARVGLNLGACWRASVGYDFLYWSDVVRPGNQIDRTINFTQSTVLTATPGLPPSGPARPAPLLGTSDFFAHGLDFSLEYRF